MPTALVSKSSNGMAAARSWLGWAAVWTIASGLQRLASSASTPGAVADVELVMDEAWELCCQALLVPARVALRAEEDRALVVVDAVNDVTQLACEITADFRADQAGRAGDEKTFHGVQ